MDILQIIGYAASIIIAFSMTLNSIVRFRWVNLSGALTFAIYGFSIGAYPVGILNSFIVSVDIYYLWRIYSKKELFDTLEVREDNRYLLKFLDFYKNEIHKFFPGFSYKPEMNTLSFFVLRNMAVTGVFLAHTEGEDVLKVGLDFVIPEYRDYKNGKFIYHRLRSYFLEKGIKTVITEAHTKAHRKYLKKIGFHEKENGVFEKNLQNG